MTPLRRPVVAGLGPGAGTSVLAAALHGVDAGRWMGGPVDVLVCPAGTDTAALPAVPVIALRGGRGPAARSAGPAVVLPEVAAWRGADATRAAAGLLGLAPHRRPPTQRGYADALLALTAALVRSGALTASPRTPAAPPAPAPRHGSAAPLAAAPRAPRTTGPRGRQTIPGCTVPARAPGRVVVADPRRRAPAPPSRPAPAPTATACAAPSGAPAERPAPSTAHRDAAVRPDAAAHPSAAAGPDTLSSPQRTRSPGPGAAARTSSTNGTIPTGTSARPTAVPARAASLDDDALDQDTLHSGTRPSRSTHGRTPDTAVPAPPPSAQRAAPSQDEVPAGTPTASPGDSPMAEAISGPLLLGSAHASSAHPSREIDVRGLRGASEPTHVDLVRGTDRTTPPAGHSALARAESWGVDPAVTAASRPVPLGSAHAPCTRPPREIDVTGLHRPSDPAHVDLARRTDRSAPPAGESAPARAESSGDPAVTAASRPLLLGSAHAPAGAGPSREIDVRGLRRPSDPAHVDLVHEADRATTPTGGSEPSPAESPENDLAVAVPSRSLPLCSPHAPDSLPPREIDVSGLHEPSDPAHVDLVREAERATSPAGDSDLARAESSGGAAVAVPPAAEHAADSLRAEPVVGPAGSAGHLDPAVRPSAAAPVLLHRAEPVRPRLVAGRALRLAGPDTAPAPGAVAPGVAAVPMPSLVRPEAARRTAEAGRRLRIAPVVAVTVRPGAGGPDDDAIEHGGTVPAEAGASALRTG